VNAVWAPPASAKASVTVAIMITVLQLPPATGHQLGSENLRIALSWEGDDYPLDRIAYSIGDVLVTAI